MMDGSEPIRCIVDNVKEGDPQPAVRDVLTIARDAADALLNAASPGFVDIPEREWSRLAASISSLQTTAADAARAASFLEESCAALLKLGLSLVGTEMQIDSTPATSEQLEGNELLEAGRVVFAEDASRISRTARLLENLADQVARNASDLIEFENPRSPPGVPTLTNDSQ
jgi:hypothetical protein